jgi:hypothetical protein
MPYQTDTTERESAFNIALRFLESLQLNLNQANYFARIGDLDSWRVELDCIYRKSYSRQTKDEQDNMKTIKEEVESAYVAYSRKRNKKSDLNKNVIALKRRYTSTLSKYEMELIKIIDRIGWLVPTKKSVLEAMDIG